MARSPKQAYSGHKSGAKQRGIPFTLTFDQWWQLWEPHWDQRGQGKFQKCMCRYHDQGGYEMGNVRIATNLENRQEASMERRVRQSQRRYRFREVRTPQGFASDWTMGRYERSDEEAEETS